MTFDNRFKNPDGTKFVPLVQDSVGGQLSPHDCKSNQQQREQQQQPSNDLSREVSAIKAQQFLVLVTRVGYLEKELLQK